MSNRYDYKIIKGSWGIAVGLHVDCQRPQSLPPDAQEVAKQLWLWVDQATWRPTPREWDALRLGVNLVADPLAHAGQLPLLVRVLKVEYRPTDYQEEGLTLALANGLSQEFGLEPPDIPVRFDRAINRYVFEDPLFIALAE